MATANLTMVDNKAFTKISETAFREMQLGAGVLMKNFTPGTTVAAADIICATTGGITASCVPTYSDLGEDVDNCPANLKELKHLDSWECTMTFTALSVTDDVLKLALGAVDTKSEHLTAGGSFAPNKSLTDKSFVDKIWWVGDRSDGGLVAICLKNALSTGGLSLQTEKDGKGQLSVELTGHVSAAAQDEMPMEFYTAAAKA